MLLLLLGPLGVQVLLLGPACRSARPILRLSFAARLLLLLCMLFGLLLLVPDVVLQRLLPPLFCLRSRFCGCLAALPGVLKTE